MKEKSLIKKNILHFLEIKGITKYKFYQKTGITNGILNQNNGISEENIIKFLTAYPEISHTWLLTGKGEMLRQNAEKTSANASNNKDIEIVASHNMVGGSINYNDQMPEMIKAKDEQITQLFWDRDKCLREKDEVIKQLRKQVDDITHKSYERNKEVTENRNERLLEKDKQINRLLSQIEDLQKQIEKLNKRIEQLTDRLLK